MSTTAQEILTLAFQDIGVLAEGETMPPAQAAQGLTRLNNMVSGWQVQPGTTTAIQRVILPLVEDKQSYTIGLGGDFNVPRPSSIAGAGLWLSGLDSAASVTSITRTGYTATVTQTSHGLSVGDEVYISGTAQPEYIGLHTVQTVPTANTYTFTVSGNATTPATGTITAQAVQGQPVEIPRSVVTDQAYQSINLKNMPNAQFTNVYYFPNQPQGTPYGTIFLWPKPNTDANQLVLYLEDVFTGFATLTAEYAFAALPGYTEALEYNIAKRLRIAYPLAQPRIDIDEMAAQSLGLIKRGNNKLVDLPTDATLLTTWPGGLFNINSGTTQGTGPS